MFCGILGGMQGQINCSKFSVRNKGGIRSHGGDCLLEYCDGIKEPPFLF